MAYMEYGGKRVFYQMDGEECSDKPLVMLLHGNTASGRMFDFVREDCQKRWRTIVVDFLGHGRSDRLERFPDDHWQDQGRQAVELMVKEGLKDVTLIGTSGGAIAAVNAAFQRPDLFRAVVADSFQGGMLFQEQEALIQEERREKLEKKIGREPEASGELEASDTAFWEYCHGADWRRVVQCDSALLARLAGKGVSLLSGKLESLEVPVLFTALREDELIPGSGRIAEDCASRVKHGRCHIFEEGSHPSMLTNWDEFFLLADQFVKSLNG